MKGAVEEVSVIDAALVGSVIDELNGRAVAEPPPSRSNLHSDERVEATEGPEIPEGSALLDAQIEAIEQAFAEQNRVIQGLRQEIAELASRKETPREERDQPKPDDDRLAAIEARLDEQERRLRQVLTMMINYFESSASRSAA